MRPLGIPCIIDRIVQQCILQVMEPICEAKFYEHSYGFRPCRSAENAISYAYGLAQRNKLHYVVDVDVKGFFDNVDHRKLLKQIWTLGIRDTKLIQIIKAMLKAPIEMQLLWILSSAVEEPFRLPLKHCRGRSIRLVSNLQLWKMTFAA